jgi:hypothetical protein
MTPGHPICNFDYALKCPENLRTSASPRPFTMSRRPKPDRRVNYEEMRAEPSGRVASTGTGGAKRCSAIKATILRLSNCSPKPSNQDHPPLFRELRPLNAQQHVARN